MIWRWATRTLATSAAVALFVALAGCSSRQLYDSALGWQRNACHRMPDTTERSQCLSSATMSYDDFRRQSEDAKANR